MADPNPIRIRRYLNGCETAEFKAWRNMLDRCNNRKNPRWLDYGGRGIKVCERWNSFDCFYEDMGPRQASYSLERKENNGHYCRENCMWASRIEQARNTRKSCILLFNGQSRPLAEWAEICGVNRKSLAARIYAGWPIEKAISTPLKQCKKSP